jgi:hypothetical protein
MLEASRRRILESLGPDQVVLDVGGWADPLPRADWVIDAMPYDTRGFYSRKGWVDRTTDEPERFDARTWIERDVCDREPFPFGDGEIDFAVCAQTLEDLRDPVWVCDELARVARAGYVEVPSRLEEQSYRVEGDWVGWSHHRWLIDVHEDALEFVGKHAEASALPECRFPEGFWETLSDEERVQGLWWSGELGATERLFFEAGDYREYLSSFVSGALRDRPAPGPPARGRLGRLLGRR